jgi:hypothetical protein
MAKTFNNTAIAERLIKENIDPRDHDAYFAWCEEWDIFPPQYDVIDAWVQLKLDNAEVGDGVTIIGWTDKHPATIVARTAKTMTVQHDKATQLHKAADLAPHAGGFACHFAEQHKQRWDIEPDPEGATQTLRLTKKGWRTQGATKNDVGYGRTKFHDYNF